jgi:hypothetical protein
MKSCHTAENEEHQTGGDFERLASRESECRASNVIPVEALANARFPSTDSENQVAFAHNAITYDGSETITLGLGIEATSGIHSGLLIIASVQAIFFIGRP